MEKKRKEKKRMKRKAWQLVLQNKTRESRTKNSPDRYMEIQKSKI